MSAGTGAALVNGTTLAYLVRGTGGPVVLIHGFTLDWRMWRGQIDVFAERYRVVAYDVRGFGQSGPASAVPHADIEDLRALLDMLEIERAHLVGLSMGGGIGLDFALTYPERTRALVLVDAAINGWQWSAAWDAAWAPIGTVIQSGDAALVAAWLAHPMFASAMAQPTVATELRGIVADYSGWHWFHHDGQRSPDPPARQRLDQVAVPTLVVVGERDVADMRACAEAMADSIPAARLFVLPAAGHMASMEQPAAFNDVVLAFLDEH